MNRRQIIATASACLVAPALPALAQRANPMPEELRRAMERDPTAPVLGNPKGDITLTEFFDYNCSFCRKMVGTVQKLIAADKNLRVVFREWPVFGEGSDFAARAALASLQQGKYWQMHAGMMTMKDRATEATVLRVARAQGVDIDKMRADMDSKSVRDHINRSRDLAEHMGLIGTPTFIAGDEGIFGHQTQDDLAALVKRGRATLG